MTNVNGLSCLACCSKQQQQGVVPANFQTFKQRPAESLHIRDDKGTLLDNINNQLQSWKEYYLSIINRNIDIANIPTNNVTG